MSWDDDELDELEDLMIISEVCRRCDYWRPKGGFSSKGYCQKKRSFFQPDGPLTRPHDSCRHWKGNHWK